MSTRLRPIAMIGGELKAGGHVRVQLEAYAKSLGITVPARGSMPESERLIQLFHLLTKQLLGQHWLWLFREPRETPASRSRYAQLCQYFGIGPRSKKKKKTQLDLSAVRRVFHFPAFAPEQPMSFAELRERDRQARAREQQAAQQATQINWGQLNQGLGAAGAMPPIRDWDFEGPEEP